MKKLLVIFYIILLSCQNNEKPLMKQYCTTSMLDYYDNGKIKTITNLLNDSTSVTINYYESGIIESTSRRKNGLRSGSCLKYDEKGNLFLIESYYLDKKHGSELKYNKGILNYLQQYIIVGDSSYLNQYIFYDDFGNIRKERSRFYSILYETFGEEIRVNQNEEIEFRISYPDVINQKYQHQIVTGEFDNFFNIINSKSLDTVLVNGIFHQLTYSFGEIGVHWVSGIILSSYTDINGAVQCEKMYFSIPFTVIE